MAASEKHGCRIVASRLSGIARKIAVNLYDNTQQNQLFSHEFSFRQLLEEYQYRK
jgi:hypothetical protein